MKRFIISAVVLGAFLLIGRAWAGEVWKGSFVTGAAASADNLEPVDGGGFVLPARAKISVQCSVDSYVCVDRRACTAAAGTKVLADTLFPTSTNEQVVFKGTGGGPCTVGPCMALADGGTILTTSMSATVSAIPVTSGAATCKVFSRFGNE